MPMASDDAAVLVSAAAILAVVCLVACAFPVGRACRIVAVDALRHG